MTDTRVFRVTVRGRFHQLSDQARRHLHDNLDEHDIFKSAYTPEGTLTYEKTLDFFNLRYELRSVSEAAAIEEGLAEAELFLEVLGFAHRDLKAQAVDMAAMWNDTDRSG